MPANTLETVWKLILDEQAAKKSEDAITTLADKTGKFGEELNKIARQKSFEDMAREAGKLALETGKAEQAAEDLYKKLKEIGATDDELKSVAKTFSDVSSGKGGEGGGGVAAAKFRGAASLIGGSGAGELVGMVDDLQDAFEGFQQLRTALTGVETAQTAATAAQTAAGAAATTAAPGFFASAAGLAAMMVPLLPFIAIGAAVAAAVVAITAEENKRAEALRQEMDMIRSINDEIASGATSEDLKEQINLLDIRSELESEVLEKSKQEYDDYIESIRNAFGGLGRLLEPFVRLFGSYEEELASQADKSQKIIDDNTKKQELYNDALEKGLTAINDARVAEEELTKSREQSEREAEQAAQKAERDREAEQRKQQQAAEKAAREQEQAAAEQQRQAEQYAAKVEQVEEKRYQAAQKYGDALVDIARKSADDADKAANALRLKQTDNQSAFNQDILDLSLDFHASEREEAIKRQEEEAADLRAHANRLAQIRDDAFTEEADLLKQRDFLGATRVRERANATIEQENKAFIEAADEKLRLQKQEDAQQLRELDKARRERLTQLQRANAEAQLQYKRDLDNQREARRIAEREAAINRDRELRAANEMARALLGVHQQTANAQLQLAQNTLNSLRGMGNTTNNNNVTNQSGNFGNITIPITTIPNTQIENRMLGVLGAIGLT